MTVLRRLASMTILCVSLWLTLVHSALAGWTPLAHTAPSGSGGVMLLLTDGTVMCKSNSGGSSYGNLWNKLTPDSTGSYVNGTWTTLAPMADTRLYFASQVLTDGRVFVAGGEYGTGGAKGETYDPIANTWTSAPAQGSTISDANSELMPDGRVLVALVTGSLRGTIIFNPFTNTWTAGPTANGIHNESAWVKLPDGSSLMVDRLSTNSERYIPSLNQWVTDSAVPVALYDPYGDETGPGFLLPDGRAFFIGSPSNTAYYTPSGNNSPGTWAAGPTIPGGQGAPDAAGAMMPNGKILCAVSPTPTSANHFPSPTQFYEFDYTTNTFTQINTPTGGTSVAMSCYLTNMLMLPDGSVLYSQQNATQYYVYTSAGSPVASGKPTVTSVSKNGDGSFHLTGTKLNGISQGAAYGDDWQMSTNYPIVRLTNGSNVYYCRTYNWSSVGVQTGSTPVTTEFTVPASLPHTTYSLYVVANGIASDAVSFTPFADLTVSLPASATEGSAPVTGTVTLAAVSASDVVVSLSSSDTTEATVPASVTIPAGQTSTTFLVTVVDDAILDGTQTATITATASGYQPGTAVISILDNESGVLSVSVPASATEGVGTVQGTVSVNLAPSSAVTVTLTSSDTTAVTVPASVTIPAGQTSANFTITVVDDTKIDGTQNATITAHVANWTDGSGSIAVLDNENTNLSLSLPASVNEGGTATGTVSISGTRTTSLTVSLSSNNTSRLTVPASVTILSGSTSATFTLTAPDNSLTDGSASATITATASGFTGASVATTVLDNDVHHYTVGAIGSPQAAGTPFTVTITAKDVNNVTITSYAGTPALTASGTAGTVTLSPTTASGFISGVWTGNVTAMTPSTNVVLTVSDGAGHTGTSNAFTVNVGPLHHFSWSTVSSPKGMNAPFSTTITAQDAANNTATGFAGTANLSSYVTSAAASQIVITEINPNTPDEIEFMNVGTNSVDISGWTIYIYDFDTGGTSAKTFTIPAGTTCAANQIFRLQENGTSPGTFPLFYYGANINWTSDSTSPTAVLLRDASGNMKDFVCAAGLAASSITSPATIPSSQWSGAQVAGPTNLAYGYSRIGNADANTAADWTTATPGMGTANTGLTTPFAGTQSAVTITPTVSGSFAGGIWTGNITVQQTATQAKLKADDGAGRTGESNAFDVIPATGPTGGTMTFSPASPVDANSSMTVTFAGWVDPDLPLSYEVLVNDVVVSAKGTSASRSLTAPITPGTYTLKGRIYDAVNNITEVVQSFVVVSSGPTSGTMTLSPTSPVAPSAALTVTFNGWTDAEPPLTYEVLVDDVVVSAQGSSASRNFTGPSSSGTHSLKGHIYDSLNNVTEVVQSFDVTGTAQTITFPDIANKASSDPAFALSATASSGLAVSYAVVSGANVAAVSGNTVTLTGVAGSVTIVATQSGGSGYGAATPVYRTFVVRTTPAFTKIAQGCRASHTAAIRADGTLWTWGYNLYGQIGNGSTTDRISPGQVGTATNWQTVAVGESHTLAIKSDGTLWAWGNNANGQLGDGTTSQRTSPVQIAAGTTWQTVAAGYAHTLAVKSDGTLWAWGLNTNGQLGDGTTTQHTGPVQIGAATNWQAVTAGQYHSVAKASDGTLWAWGYNNSGQLGDGTTTQRLSPVQVGTATNWQSVASGSSHNVALKADGTLWVWGYNFFGQLGDATVTDRTSPKQIGTSTWQSASASSLSTFAIRSDGTPWAWGYNREGNVGDGTNTQRNSPVQIGSGTTWQSIAGNYSHAVALKSDGTLWAWGYGNDGQLAAISRPVPLNAVLGNQTVLSAAGGTSHSATIKNDGTLWAWGYNFYGQVGDGTATDRINPVQVGAATNWRSVMTRSNHNLALRSDGTLWAWGYNLYGQIGDGTTLQRNSPVQIAGTTWQSIAAGGFHSAALKINGTLWAWGYNTYGQVGDASTTNRPSPVQVGTDTNWQSVATGFYHTVALKSDGTLWSWGWNNNGQLGDGTTTNRSSPVQVGVATNWVSVAAGYAHTLALKSDGTLWAWGRNLEGELGDGTTTQRISPVQVGAATNWQTVTGGYYHTLALKSDGTLWAWGSNTVGELGDGSTVTQRTSPQQVGTSRGWSLSNSGFAQHSLVTRSGRLWGFGLNSNNQVPGGEYGRYVPRISIPSRAAQTTSIPAFTPAVGVPVTLAATSTSGLSMSYAVSGPATLSGNVLTLTGPGTVTLDAWQVGDDNAWQPSDPASAVITPDISVEQPSGTVLTDGTASIAFGTVFTGASSAVKTFTIRNTSDVSDLTGLSISKDGSNSGDFSVNTTGMAIKLAPGASTTFTVTFSPTGDGARSAAIHIASNVTGTKNPFDIALTGTGDAPPTLSPVAIASNNPNPIWAKLGNTVTLSFTANKPIQAPVVTLLGSAATVANSGGNNWTATATVGAAILDGADTAQAAPTEQGAATFSITATDLAGNTAAPVTATTNASAVTVDITPPMLFLPGEEITAEAASAAGSVVNFTASATDNLDPAPSFTISPLPGSTFPIGSTIVNASSTDAAGNTAGGSFTVIVQDTTAPVVTPPANVIAEATSAAGAVVSYPAATATDAVGVISIGYSQDSGTTFPIGTTTVIVAARDAATNLGTATFTVTVRDTTAPVIAAHANVTVEATSAAGAVVNYAAASATDAVGVTSLTYSQNSGTTFPIGSTTVTITARDAPNNTSTGTFTVTVQDTTAPVVTPPANVTVEATSAAGAVVNYPAATASDTVGVTSITYSQNSGTTFPIGTTTVTITAKDAANNTGTGTFTVTVQDTTAPVVGAHPNVTVEATSAAGAVVNYAAATASDAVGVTSITYSQNSGTTFPIGTTTVTITAKDAANNTGTGTFTVTVRDTTAPVVAAHPNVTVEATSAAGAVVNYAAGSASDVVGVTSITYSQNSGTTFPIGVTTVTITAKDAANNTGTGMFTVTVQDTTAPVVTPPANITVAATSPSGATVTFGAAGVSDAVGVTSVTYSQASGSNFPVGTTTVTITARDAANNAGTGSFTVTVTQVVGVQGWRQQYFGITANTGNAADGADPNNNGIKNLLEYALGGDPVGGTTGQGILPQLGRSAGNALQVSFTRYVDRSDLTLTVQGADSAAGPWTGLAQSTAGGAFAVVTAGAAVSESGAGNARSVTVTDLYAVTDAAHPSRFLRLSVTDAEPTTAATDPVGFMTLNIIGTGGTKANESSYLGLSMAPAVQYQAVAETVSGATFSCSTATWTNNQYANTPAPGYFLEVCSGAMSGLTTPVISCSAANKTLTVAENLTSLGVESTNVTFKIRPNWSLAGIFGATNSAGLGAGTSTTADLILVYNATLGGGTGGYDQYFYSSGGLPGVGWRKVGTGNANQANTPFKQDAGLIIVRLQASSLKLPLAAAVKLGPTLTTVFAGGNVIGNEYPSGVLTLGLTDASATPSKYGSNLYTGSSTTGVVAGTSTTADLVLIYNPGISGYDQYFYSSGGLPGVGWRKVGTGNTNQAATVLSPGKAIYLKRNTSAGNFNWVIPQPFPNP